MPGKSLLHLADETLALIGLHIAAQNEDLAIKLARGDVNEREIHRFPNHIIPFRSTCQRIRQLVPLTQLGIVVRVSNDHAPASSLEAAVQRILDKIPTHCVSAIRFLKLDDHNDDDAICLESVYNKVVNSLPSLERLSIDTYVEGCLDGTHEDYAGGEHDLKSLSCTGGFHGCLQDFTGSLLSEATSLSHLRITVDPTMRTLAQDFVEDIMSAEEDEALRGLESLSIPLHLIGLPENHHSDSETMDAAFFANLAARCPKLKELTCTNIKSAPPLPVVHACYYGGRIELSREINEDGSIVEVDDLMFRALLRGLPSLAEVQCLVNMFSVKLDLTAWAEEEHKGEQTSDWLDGEEEAVRLRVNPVHVETIQRIVTLFQQACPTLRSVEVEVVADIGSHKIVSWWEWHGKVAEEGFAGNSIDVAPHRLRLSVHRYRTLVKSMNVGDENDPADEESEGFSDAESSHSEAGLGSDDGGGDEGTEADLSEGGEVGEDLNGSQGGP